MKTVTGSRKALVPLAVLLALAGPVTAGLLTFADVGTGEHALTQTTFDGLPDGVTMTPTEFWHFDGGGHGDSYYIYPNPASNSRLTFNTLVEVPSLWLNALDSGAATIAGYNGDTQLWSASIPFAGNTWSEITAGSGYPIDNIRFPTRWLRVDDMTVTPLPLLPTGVLLLVR